MVAGAQVKTIAEELGLAFLGIGFDPKWQVEDVPIMPKNRYRRAALFAACGHVLLAGRAPVIVALFSVYCCLGVAHACLTCSTSRDLHDAHSRVIVKNPCKAPNRTRGLLLKHISSPLSCSKKCVRGKYWFPRKTVCVWLSNVLSTALMTLAPLAGLCGSTCQSVAR